MTISGYLFLFKGIYYIFSKFRRVRVFPPCQRHIGDNCNFSKTKRGWGWWRIQILVYGDFCFGRGHLAPKPECNQ